MFQMMQALYGIRQLGNIFPKCNDFGGQDRRIRLSKIFIEILLTKLEYDVVARWARAGLSVVSSSPEMVLSQILHKA